MRKWLLGAICAALVVAAPQSVRAFSDGHQLLEAAESENIVDEAMFVMYVAGVAMGVRDVSQMLEQSGKFDISQPFCVSSKNTYKDLGDVVRIWLRNQPDIQGSAALLVVFALSDHFPCETERP